MSDEHVIVAANGEKIDLKNLHAPFTARDLFRVSFFYGLGGGGVNAIIGTRFLVMGQTPQDHAAGIMFYVVAALMVFAGAWCQVKSARLRKASK